MAKPTRRKPAKRPIVTYTPKGYEPKRIYQRISSEDMFEDLGFDPRYLPWLYVDNIIMRVFARTMGQGPYGPVTIKCSEDGSLFVAGLGGGYTRNVVHSGTAPDAYAGPTIMVDAYGRVDIFTFDNKMVFKRSRDNVVWDSEIELFKDSFYSIDVKTLAFDVKNYAAGLNARYQIIGWY